AHYKIDLKQLEEYRADLSNVETQIKNIEAEIEAKKIEISSLKGQINFIQQGAKIGSSQTLDRINESEKNLRAAVENWKQNFLLIAPVDGAVSFFEKDGKQKQFVKKGDEILVVVPEGGERKMVAKVALPVKENGKVKPNQRVLIRLSSFPYQEYGKLEGKVQYVAEVPKDGFISLEVSLPEGLKTNKNKTINFEQQLMGTAEIITEEKRFMVRVVESIF
ncbi:MAG TPA: HlyD family efflux transporter periplasmic adaptor subunit, partial [Saprospiraceae bacterium]|nr:HlyD family efflux transporter periplasmic adaptor subunit [Saprospiraceae bacterium]